MHLTVFPPGTMPAIQLYMVYGCYLRLWTPYTSLSDCKCHLDFKAGICLPTASHFSCWIEIHAGCRCRAAVGAHRLSHGAPCFYTLLALPRRSGCWGHHHLGHKLIWQETVFTWKLNLDYRRRKKAPSTAVTFGPLYSNNEEDNLVSFLL